MGKLALEKPLAKPAKPVTAPNSELGNTDFRSAPEPLQLLSSFAFKQTVPDEVSGLTDKLWQPMIQATLEQVGQTLLDWCWKAFEQRYGEQLKHLNTARALSSQLLDPQLSLQAKCTALLNVLETSTVTGGSITPYMDVARQLKTIFNGLQLPGSSVIKRGVDTLSNLLALLDLPAAQQMADKDTLSPVRHLLSGALDWAQMLQRLSNVSWDSPQAIVDGLLQSGALPTWVIDIIEQGQKLYETLSSRLTAIKHKGQQLQRLHGLLEQFNQATSIKAKFAALLTLLLDEDMIGLIEQYAPAAMGDSLKVFVLFKDAIQDGGEQDTLGLRTTLLSMEHVTSQPFIDRLGSEAGAIGQLMVEPLGNVRAALRGSASQEAAFNLLLGLTDPKKTWTAFVMESSREMLLLPQVQDLGASFASRFAWQAQAIKALYGVLDDTFWAHYKTAAWAQLPSLISDTALRDAQNKQSQLAIALAAASGIPGEHIQTVFTEVSRVCRSWGNDSWSEFLPKVTESVNSLLSVLVQHGQVLPTYVQTLLDIGLWAAKGITRLLMLHAVWKAKADDEVLGEATLALIRKAIEEYAGENAAWAFDKAVIWLPMLPPLYKVLGNLEPIKEGQRVQWLANLLMRLYGLPEAQANKDIIWVREQIEAKAEHWLGGIPAAMLGNAIVEEIQSKPGYDLTPMFTRAVQLQGLATYMSDCFAKVTNALQGVDVMSGIHAILNPARVQVPSGQRPAYLRDPTTLNFVLPESHPQQPLSTTAQNIAPVAWGAGAGATFLGGILFTYFAYKNYRKGNQIASQPGELDMPLVERSNDLNASGSQSAVIQDEPLLNGTPYKATSVPLNQKSSHWKKTGPLAAMASMMFGASAYSLWKTQSALANNAAREKVNVLEALEAKAREDFYAGNTNTLLDDVTQFLETLSTFESFNDINAAPTTTFAPEIKLPIPIQSHMLFQQQESQHSHGPSASDNAPLTLHRVRRSTPISSNQGLSIDNVLPLMKEAQVLIQTIITNANEGKTQQDLAYLYGRLGQVKLELNALRDNLSHLTPDSSGQLLTNREVYAYYLLAEMKAYYSNEEDQLLWGEFAPYTNIVFHYQNTQGQPQRSSVPLIDFLNGNIKTKMVTLGANGLFTFSAAQESSEVAEQLRAGTTNYIPGNWTKTKKLRMLHFHTHQNDQNLPPRMSDEVILKNHPHNPLGESMGPVRETRMTLDAYLSRARLNHVDADPYDTHEVMWPKHYTPQLKLLISQPSFATAYNTWQQTIAELNERLEELRKEKIEAYDKTIKTYSGDDVLSNSELITQYSWQDLIFENDGTPIGFIEDDVINRAILNVEARILHSEKQRDLVVNAPEWQQDFQSEIEKLVKVLSVLHQKQGNSERLEAESLSGKALFDTQVEALAADLWTQPEYQNRLKQHPQLSRLTPESILSVKITQGTQITYASLPLQRILAGEHLRLETSGSAITVSWPSGLTTRDTLLNDLTSECTRYRKSLDIGLETKNAVARINIPTTDNSLQQGLEQVFAQTPSAQRIQGAISVNDKVNVRFFPTTSAKKRIKRFAPMGIPYMVATEPVVNQEYTLKQVMGKAPEAKILGMMFYNRLEVDTDEKYPKEVIDALRKVDWQRKLQDNLDKLRNDQNLKDHWRLVFSPLISNTIGKAGTSRVNTVQLNSVSVPGAYKIAHTNGSIELHSIFNSRSWKFKSTYDLSIALDTANSITPATSNSQSAPDTAQNNHLFYTWLNEHQEKYYVQQNSGGNYLTSVNPGETVTADRVADLALDDLISSLYSNADTWLKSDAELSTQRIFRFFENVVAPVIGLLTTPVSGPLAFLISAGLATVPFGELTIADTQEEFKEIAMNAAVNAAFELGSEVVIGGLSKIPAQKIITAATTKKTRNPSPGQPAQPAPAEILRLEPFRHSSVGKIDNLEAGTEHYLAKLKENRAILNAIDRPDGTCANLLSIVGPRISQADIGMTDIKYRGLLIWNNAMEVIPSNHFVVLGSKNGQRYVFDLSARQFHNKGMPDLDGPLILKEADWVQKYANATTRKLIKYKDFGAPDSATNTFRSLPGLFSPGDLIDDGILLTMPQWYKTLTHWNPSRSTQNFSEHVYGSNAPREAAQALNSSAGSNSRWDYAIEVLRDADMLTPTQAQKLTTGLINASNNRGLGSSGRIDNLLSDIRTVNTAEGLLRIRKGELVVFMQANSSAPEKGLYPVHIVTSLGNGRFAGVQNSLINPALGDHKGIINAEQFRAFTRPPGSPTWEIKAGFPMGYKSPYASTLTEAASSAARVVETDISSAQYVSRTLELSGDLAYEQAQALKNAAIRLAEPSGEVSGITIDNIMINPKKLTTLEALKSVPKGHIVATTSSHSNVSHIMLSLGNERFATSGLNSLNPDLPHAKSIVSAEKLHKSMQEGTLGGLDLESGAVNIKNLRADALRIDTDPTLLPKISAQPLAVSTSATLPKIIDLTFNNHHYKITATPLKNKTTLYSVADDPAEAISVSSHGEYSLNSATMKAPDDMSIEFLAPHGWALQNSGGTGFFNVESGMRPHSTVSNGANTIVFSPHKASDNGNKPSVLHAHNTVLLDATGTTKPNQIMDYTLAHFQFELPQDIATNIALNRELVTLKQPNIRKTDYLTIDQTNDGTSFSSVITELKQLPVPPKTVTAVFCRSLRPSTTYSYNPMGENSSASHILKGHQNTYDITGSQPVLTRRVLVTLSRPFKPASDEGSNRNSTSNTTVNEGDVTVIAGPFKNDVWQKKAMWTNGLAFSQFEALDDSGSMHLADTSSNFLTLTAKDPVAADRWLLEWSINTGPTQDRKGRKTASTMEGLLENIGPLVSVLTAHTCTYKICTGAQNRVLAEGSINQKMPISWLGNLQYGHLNLNISDLNAEHDEKLRSFTGDQLNRYFSVYMTDKNFTSGFNANALDIVDFLLKYHATKHPEGLQSPVTNGKIEDTFTELFMSQPIAEALAYMLMANERSIKIAPGSSPFSREQLSSFIRTLTESALKVLNFDVNDDGLHRGSMAGRFESDKAQLVNSHNLRPELAAYLIAIRYMDADIDKILSKTKRAYPASSTVNNRPYTSYQRVGTIAAKKDENRRYTALTRDNRAQVRLYKGITLIFEKTYEIPPRYRGGMMSRYIANAISVDMNLQRFDISVQHPSSIVAGVREAIYSQQGLRGYQVIPGYEDEIPIYSDINRKNPGNNFKVVVIFV